MSTILKQAFKADKPTFITYITAGFPHRSSTVPAMLALQAGGADIIELGVPFSDPIADGPTIQYSSHTALTKNGITLPDCLEYVKEARSSGLTVPVILMGYYNPFLSYDTPSPRLMADCAAAGVDGFIVVDLPPGEAALFRKGCAEWGLSYVPLIAPSTSEDRVKSLVSIADSFIYVVSTMGVTGARSTVSADLPSLVARIRAHTSVPLAVGFGVSCKAHFDSVAECADGVVIGSRIIQLMRDTAEVDMERVLTEFARDVCGKSEIPVGTYEKSTKCGKPQNLTLARTDTPGNAHKALPRLLPGRFGEFGGQYAPEALVDCLDEIEKAFEAASSDPAFWQEFRDQYSYMGRPSSLHEAKRLTAECGGAKIWLKREDLNHTGSHKINNAMGQILLALRLGKKRIIAETGAGQHGVATATVCAKFGLECVIYMGAEDVRRQALNVFRIKLLGATVIPVESGSRTLKDAINEAMRDWVANVATTHYLVGSAIGPHPFPTIVREFQSVIGKETREYFISKLGRLPDAVVACVGGGSNAIGMFHPFVNDTSVQIIGVEAGGDGIHTTRHSASLSTGRPGVLHGTKTYLIQTPTGQISETHSISAGLDYPGVGPEHAFLKDCGRAVYTNCTDAQAMIGLRSLTQLEGILPALESAHAVFEGMRMAREMKGGGDIVICVSGRGDKDVQSVADALPSVGEGIGWDLRF